MTQEASAFGVIHKRLGDDDPKMPAPVKRPPGSFDPSAIRGKLAPLKAEAVKAAKVAVKR